MHVCATHQLQILNNKPEKRKQRLRREPGQIARQCVSLSWSHARALKDNVPIYRVRRENFYHQLKTVY